MNRPVLDHENAVQALLHDTWGPIFTHSTTQSITWSGGPTQSRVAELLLENGLETPERRRLLIRQCDFLAWAIVRGPQMSPADEAPWNIDQLSHELDHTGYRRPQHVTETITLLEDTDLSDLHTFAGNPRTYAQAEIAAGLRSSVGGLTLVLFDQWLLHGGWAHAGMLLDHTAT